MKIMSFAWTTPALVTGNQTCTRRVWSQEYAGRIHNGELMAAYNKNPHAGGAHVATIRLTAEPHTEWLSSTPDSDYDAEGFAWLLAHPNVLDNKVDGIRRDDWLRTVCTREGFHRRRDSGGAMWVVRFVLVDLTEFGHALKNKYDQLASLASLSA